MKDPTLSSRSRRLLILLALTGLVIWGVFIGLKGEESGDTPPNAISEIAESHGAAIDGGRGDQENQNPTTETEGVDDYHPSAEVISRDRERSGEDDGFLAHETAERAGENHDSDNSDSPDAAEIDRAIENFMAIKAIEEGIRAARANPSPPPAIAKAMSEPVTVPIELQEASRQPKNTPPEILEMMRQERKTPPEIAQAMADAQAKGTSDELRAYMAGETDQLPEN